VTGCVSTKYDVNAVRRDHESEARSAGPEFNRVSSWSKTSELLVPATDPLSSSKGFDGESPGPGAGSCLTGIGWPL